MAELFPPTLDDMIACARKEVRQRLFVYPRRVALRKMTAHTADREIALMQAIVSTLEKLRAGGHTDA